MSGDFDREKIEQLIQQARQERARHMAEFWKPSIKRAAGSVAILLLALLASLKGGSDS